MSDPAIYDPYEHLLSPQSKDLIDEFLNSPNIFDAPNIFDLNNAATPDGMIPSNGSTSSSPPRSTTVLDAFSFDEFENNFQSSSSFEDLGTTLPTHDVNTTKLNYPPRSMPPLRGDLICNPYMKQDDGKLHILAEPKALYRERYPCEIDPTKNRAQRFIRSEEHNSQYEYPTIKIPAQWRDPNRQLFIRVTLVTVSEEMRDTCIHPYVIDTPEKTNVVKDPDNNSLYFRIAEEEFQSGEKSFRITRKKMVQHDLKAYGPWRLFYSNQNDIQRVQNPLDAKQLITAYQLWKSKLVFTIAERQNGNTLPVSISQTSVESHVMIDEASDKRNVSINNSDNTNACKIKCIPQKGDWHGGDEVLIILPNRIKRKVYTISFDFGSLGQISINEMTYIDTKTILFRTPPCPSLPVNENVKVSIIITSKESFRTHIDFHYLTPIISNNICRNCQIVMTNINISNKRRYNLVYDCEMDGGETLISEMNRLSIEQKPVESRPPVTSDEKFDKYLNQLKDALADYVRTNNPSRLFRRTRLLLVKCEEKPPPLNDAIQRGYFDLALSLIEQVIEMHVPNGLLERENENGQTPLLIAAKINQWKLIEVILKKRFDLVQQKDKNGNNLFHLLANLSEDDKAAETMKNVMKILPIDVIANLLKENNGKSQTAMEVAQSNSNTQCMDLLMCSIDVGKNNA